MDNQVNNSFAQDWENREEEKELALFELLQRLGNQQTIIYCSTPQRVRYLSSKFCDFLEKQRGPANSRAQELKIIQWVELNIDPKWGFIKCLNNRVGIHDGALQRHITTTVLTYFNKKKIDYLFCTSTIIEGVNTTAKNVVIFDKRKGRHNLDFFDYNNIKGRSGRLLEHYVGKVYNFIKIPEEEDIVVDIPFYEQPSDLSDEILIQLDPKDVRNPDSEQYKLLKKLPRKEFEMLRENGVSVKGQMAILNQLRDDFATKYKLIFWSGYPRKNQLTYVLSLGWDNLVSENETTVVVSVKQLVRMTMDYSKGKSIKEMINSTEAFFKKMNKYQNYPDQAIYDEAVRFVFQVMRHWFSFKLPKWLSAINELQKYVCLEKKRAPGSYKYYASLLENDFIRSNLSILSEYGVPKSAIMKLTNLIPESLGEEAVLDLIRKEKLFENPELIDYEKDKLKQVITLIFD